MQNKVPKVLQPALRQFRHNTPGEEGFVFAYDMKTVEEILSSLLPETEGDVYDNQAVDMFAVALKVKMHRSRMKGRSGWQHREQCPTDMLMRDMAEHLLKGNEGTWEDVATYCLFMWARGDNPEQLRTHVIHESAKYSRRLIEEQKEEIERLRAELKNQPQTQNEWQQLQHALARVGVTAWAKPEEDKRNDPAGGE